MQNRKPRIFFVMKTNDYSGAEAVNITIIKNLKNKFDFYWVSQKGNINKKLKEEKIKWIEIKKLSIREMQRVINDYRPDILHATDYTASIVCAPFARKTSVINHLHNNSPWLKKRCVNSFLYRYAAKRATKVLVVSESIINEYVYANCIIEKMINIGNPVSREEILSKVDKNEKKEYDICCVARIVPQKNPWKFLEIIAELKKKRPNIKVVWVGKGENKDEIENYSHKLGLDENIDFVGFQKNPWQYMAKSKIFMMTSSYEGYGLVVFEALSLGLPCVVSGVGGLVNIVTDDCGRLCRTKGDFVEECNLLLSSKRLLDNKSQQSILRSRELDNIDKYMAQISSLYGELYES
ncbi:glycosyltransferase [Candidatus Saccharibacteria bacterium]|nr:glycosyltransferase [Candidatus Saccharibacteria bacterium]